MIVDVGTNNGDFSVELARLNPRETVLAIEPNPSLARAIRERATAEGFGNIAVIPVAVSDHTGRGKLHFAEHHDQGVSSLLPFDTETVAHDEYWRLREDLYFDDSVTVTVTTLEAILAEHVAPRIRFVKIDAQGVDLAALRGFGSYLRHVEAGMIEASTTPAGLYRRQGYKLATRQIAIGKQSTTHGQGIRATRAHDTSSVRRTTYSRHSVRGARTLPADLLEEWTQA